MTTVTDPRMDEHIKTALRNADENDQLDVVAAVTGVAGGAKYLRELASSDDELSIMDRGMLGLHLLP